VIRINLLPREEKREVTGLGGVLLGIVAIVAMIAALAVVDVLKTHEIEAAERRLRNIKQEVKKLEDIRDKVEEFKVKNQELEARINIIKVLEANRRGPLYVLEALSEAIPGRAWLDKLKEKRFYATLEGVAWNEKTIADFMRNLEASPYFEDVQLREIKTKTIRALPLKTFKIQTRFNYAAKAQKKAGTTEADAGVTTAQGAN